MGRWIHLAAERYFRFRVEGREFNSDKALDALEFFSFLKHSKGEWAGKTFVLEPWEQFLIWNLFGWEDGNGLRLIRTSYNELARKNGKSTLAAGVGLKLLVADKEPGAEVYCAATKRDQAKIVWGEARRMVLASPALRSRVSVYRGNLSVESTGSKFEPLGADEDTLDGLNIHGAIIDELHAHKSRAVWDVLETGTGSRRQPLLLAITTAGTDRHSVCRQQHDYAEKVLEGIIDDPTYMPLIYTIDEKDDWQDEACWPKANPNLGISLKISDLRTQAVQAAQLPAKENSFRRLKLNQWTESITRWIGDDKWKACNFPVDEEALRGRTCYAGLDLSSTNDLTALVYVFPPEDDEVMYRVVPRFFVPEENIAERAKRDRVPYDAWSRQGHLCATPGNVVDYGYVLKTLADDKQKFVIQELAYDRWGAEKIRRDIEEMDIVVVPFGQGFQSMGEPTKELERLVLGRLIAHGNHPVLRWNAANVVVRLDPAGNKKPDKSKSTERIDGIVALIMGLDRATRHADDPSIYSTRGVISG